MDAQNFTPEEQRILSETFPEPAPLEPTDELQELRLERMTEFEAAALADPNPLSANLGAISASLMRIASGLGPAIEAELRAGISSPQDLHRLMQSVNTHLKITRQIQQLAQAGGRA